MNKLQKEILETKVIEHLKKDNGYIKGFGQNMCRLMYSKHNPVVNVPKDIVTYLFNEGVLIQDGLIFKYQAK